MLDFTSFYIIALSYLLIDKEFTLRVFLTVLGIQMDLEERTSMYEIQFISYMIQPHLLTTSFWDCHSNIHPFSSEGMICLIALHQNQMGLVEPINLLKENKQPPNSNYLILPSIVNKRYEHTK